MLSILSQLFITERHRQRAANVGFSLPALLEHDTRDPDIEPLLATNMGGMFLRTRVSSTGCARSGFSECPLDNEPALLHEFCRVLIAEGEREAWGNTVSTVSEGLDKVQRAGLTPTALVSVSKQPEVPEGLRAFTSELPCEALIAAQPGVTGLYTRIGDHVSILAQKVSTAFVVVL